MSTNTEQKTGALHLRLMDNEEQYSDMLAYLLYYNKDNEHYTTDVLGALEDGLENYNRFQKLDNALSPRFIKSSLTTLSTIKNNDLWLKARITDVSL